MDDEAHESTALMVEVAGERALERRLGDVRMLFGLGPPHAGAPAEERAAAVLEALGQELEAIRWCQQIHGRVVASLDCEPDHPLQQAACVGKCDALITAAAGIGLLLWTADCVPILVTGGGVVAAVHAGWRGAAADIVGRVVRRFEIEFGVPPEDLAATLGPAVSGENYPVGAEVIDALTLLEVAESVWRRDRHVDLRSFLTARLEALGLDPSAVNFVGPCTAASEHLASYRRDGDLAGRQWSLIYRS
ncbi:MAG: polyphenol oxidase family protein [Acidobacteriota bacterium]